MFQFDKYVYEMFLVINSDVRIQIKLLTKVPHH